MSTNSNLKASDEKVLNCNSIIKANAILYEYFRNNRYPKRVEKLRLAEKAGVSLQFVINFFYNTRSRIKSLEKRQVYLNNNYKNSYYYSGSRNFYRYPMFSGDDNYFTFRSPEYGVCVLNGRNNSLYKSLPIVSQRLLEEETLDNQSICTNIQLNDEINQENLSNFNENF